MISLDGEVAWVGDLEAGCDLSDRLVSLLGPDIILVATRAIARDGGGGLLAGLQRIQQAAAEATEARQVKAIDDAEAASDSPLTPEQILGIMGETAAVDPGELMAEMLRRLFGPGMTAWKLDVLRHVEIDGTPALEVAGLTPGDANQICLTVADQAGFFPWPGGLRALRGVVAEG